MSFQSAEYKLRQLALQNAALVAALTFAAPSGASVFMWMDRQIAQGDLGVESQGRTVVTVHRVSTADRTRLGNQGGPVQNISQPRIQINVTDYNAERARQVAHLVILFMRGISLLDPGEFGSPQTSPTQAPNFLLNQRAGMDYKLQPPAYVETMDWRVWNNESIPS